jgi:uncharacterized membrane protein
MRKQRLEAFSDGVIAILITIMVFDIKAPSGSDLPALMMLVNAVSTYVLSFLYLGIYWNNHHHMFQLTERVNGAVLWANLHLLFWLSLLPVATSWLRSSHYSALPAAAYGMVLLVAALAYYILQSTIIHADGPGSKLREAIGSDLKGKISPLIYVVGIAVAFVQPMIAIGVYSLAALIWLVPDRRIESKILQQGSEAVRGGAAGRQRESQRAE